MLNLSLLPDSDKSEYLKLKSLYISNFKNLKDFNMDFSNNNLTMLIGNNGSGKSNILEAISSIFCEIFVELKQSFAFNLVYEIKQKTIFIQKQSPRAKIKYFVNNIENEKITLVNNDLLPKKIISMYSGDESRLWNNYYKKSYKMWLKNIHSGKPNDMIYIDKNYWNIALFSLMLSDNDEDKEYLKNELGISNFEKVIFKFDVSKIENSKDARLTEFIEKVNDNYCSQITMLLDESIIEDYKFYWSSKEIFDILNNASMAKNNRLITSIEMFFSFNNEAKNLTIEDLSEGQNKKLLLKSIFDFIAFENTILLLDEPDAHLHEIAKNSLYDYLNEYSSEHYRQIIITTHSAMLTHLAKSESIKMLNCDNDIPYIENNTEVDMVAKLTDNVWSKVEQNIFLNSLRPLILTEGIIDLNYIKEASSLFENDYNIKFDCLPFNGADNAKDFLQLIQKINKTQRKIIVLFDRDKKGQENLSKIVTENNENINLDNSKVYRKSNLYLLMLPKTQGHQSNEFLIEDYFSSDAKKACIEDSFNNISTEFCKIPTNFQKTVKSKLRKTIDCHTPECMAGFRVLLETIKNIINEEATITFEDF